MNTFSTALTAAEYVANMDTQVLLGKVVVTVCNYVNDSRTGSYARGFKFSIITYGYLLQMHPRKGNLYSADNGVTWHKDYYSMKKQRAGKIKLVAYKSKEFAFDAIQKINLDYDSNFQWKP